MYEKFEIFLNGYFGIFVVWVCVGIDCSFLVKVNVVWVVSGG